MDGLKAMKAELAMMREENIRMEARLIAAESALEEKKSVLSEYKATAKLGDELLVVVLEAGGDNLQENTYQKLDDEIMKGLIEEAMRDFTEVLTDGQTRRSQPTGGGHVGGGREGTSGDHNLNVDGGKEGGANGGGHDK